MTPEQLDDIEQRAIARSALDDREQEVLALVAEVRRLRAVVDAVDKIHEPTGARLVAEIDGFGGEQREIEPDSFEEITSREVVCMACAGYPVCSPTVEAVFDDDGSNGWLVTHHSLDGREAREQTT